MKEDLTNRKEYLLATDENFEPNFMIAIKKVVKDEIIDWRLVSNEIFALYPLNYSFSITVNGEKIEFINSFSTGTTNKFNISKYY